MKFCKYCGSGLNVNESFCTTCGKNQHGSYCMHCGQKLGDGAKFCMGCGKSVNPAEKTNNVVKEIVVTSPTKDRTASSTSGYGSISGVLIAAGIISGLLALYQLVNIIPLLEEMPIFIQSMSNSSDVEFLRQVGIHVIPLQLSAFVLILIPVATLTYTVLICVFSFLNKMESPLYGYAATVFAIAYFLAGLLSFLMVMAFSSEIRSAVEGFNIFVLFNFFMNVIIGCFSVKMASENFTYPREIPQGTPKIVFTLVCIYSIFSFILLIGSEEMSFAYNLMETTPTVVLLEIIFPLPLFLIAFSSKSGIVKKG